MMTALAMPRISIVVPSLNQARYLADALASVIGQGYPCAELIVIDGGSTDGSVGVLEGHAASITRWLSEPDGGPADALNKGARLATGEVIGFLNADDFLLPGALAAVGQAFAASPSLDVVSGHGYYANAAGKLGAPAFSDRWDATRFRYGACVLLQPATFVRRAAFHRAGGFRQTGRVCWDMELWSDLARSGARFGTVDTYIAAFRLHDQSITGRPALRRRRIDDSRQVMTEMRGRPEGWMDRAGRAYFRLAKAARHPLRSLQQRFYFYSTLERWSL
jgi:glycosyltransferase involved in cell wall biosynthesis